MKFVMRFDTKSNEISTSINGHDGSDKDDDVENKEHEKKLVEKRKEKMKNKFLHKVDNKKVKHNKKERKAKKECSENEILNKARKHNIAKVREHDDELLKSKKIVKDLRSDAERGCVECDALQNRSACIEVRHKVLVKQSKDELCIAMLVQQEEECFELEDVKNKINDEFKLDVKEEYFDECGLESASDDEKDLLRSMFDGLMCCVCCFCCVRRNLN